MKKILNRLYLKLKYLKYRKIYSKFSNYTMISEDIYGANLELCEKFANVAGSIVECGTWKGGMIAGIASRIGKEKRYFLFDSFEGLPPAKEIDGASAINWQADTTSDWYHDNCTASEQSAHEAMNLAGTDNYTLVKGWFNETLPTTEIEDGISILRMDGDWYDSTLDILENLFPIVTEGGVIIIDDYYTWDGCSKAVHDFLSMHKRPERIKTYDSGICYIIKRATQV